MLSRHAIAYLFSHGIPSIIGFISIVVYTNLLTPEQYGVYAIVFAMAAVVNSVMFEWLRLSLLRFYPKYGHSPQVIETVKLSFMAIMVVTAIFSLLIFAFYGEQFSAVSIGFILLLSWSQSWANMNLSLARAELAPKKYGVIAFSRATLGFLFGTILIYLGFGEQGLLAGLIIGFWLALILPTIKTWGLSLNVKAFDKSLLKEFASYGTPLTLTLLLGVIIHNSDRLIIDHLLSKAETGIYASTYDLTEQSIFTLMMIINLAAFPIAMKMMEEKGEKAAYDQVKKNISLLFFIALPAAGAFIVLGPNIISVLLGEGFQNQGLLLVPFIVVGALLKGFKLYCVDIMFHIQRKTKLQIIPVVIAAIVNIVLNFMLIPQYGIEGAAFATVTAYLVAVISGWLIVHFQIHSIPIAYMELTKIAIATGFMCFVLSLLRGYSGWQMLIIQVVVGLGVYVIACLLLNILSVRDQVLRRLKERF
ncbi:oligosaccharide flippase family protein [Bacillus suaedae]|uniref:Polysaccharide biosynthesis protein n=1 Tax=Halalkalibacter suaedae TaxID=2822140 RepID=A0A941ASV5_9BACI|nr:oligosaccharide flippase family protein [Bacillus suaedae]MBP3950069.1 polysaccharide biosynthesis protein [Bacillus suaedae]